VLILPGNDETEKLYANAEWKGLHITRQRFFSQLNNEGRLHWLSVSNSDNYKKIVDIVHIPELDSITTKFANKVSNGLNSFFGKDGKGYAKPGLSPQSVVQAGSASRAVSQSRSSTQLSCPTGPPNGQKPRGPPTPPQPSSTGHVSLPHPRAISGAHTPASNSEISPAPTTPSNSGSSAPSYHMASPLPLYNAVSPHQMNPSPSPHCSPTTVPTQLKWSGMTPAPPSVSDIDIVVNSTTCDTETYCLSKFIPNCL
jgi:hypothetical protein